MKLAVNLVNKNRVDSKKNHKAKNLFTFFVSKKLIKADFFIFSIKKNFFILQNLLI